ncbi:hypothetical protein ACGF13_04920 [Kitasatospora sp. NPDC048286]|uniref:hypothetical protein n=1 Tax=Kitasatospora sp. NPDC048286 TaxID=3364047 RepID=UPI0037231C61
MATWAALLVVVPLMPLLPGRWGERDRQWTLGLLWWLLVFIGPFVACAVNRRWIHADGRKPGGAGRRR